MMGQLLEVGQAEEAGRTLDGMKGAEDRVQGFFVFRISFDFEESDLRVAEVVEEIRSRIPRGGQGPRRKLEQTGSGEREPPSRREPGQERVLVGSPLGAPRVCRSASRGEH